MNALVTLSIGAVTVVLALGLFNMLRGDNPNRSQRLMRLRVMLQFLAIALMVAVMWYRAG